MKTLPALDLSKDAARHLSLLPDAAASVSRTGSVLDRPIYGTTLFLAHCDVETIYGQFKAHVFQDIIHKGYIISLSFGDIENARRLHTRVHSSCVTSETLRACDCDCVQQLEGAFKVISERGSGVLFYLMQEGRGSGYVAKARDRMVVQASNDELSTFEAYHMMGLRKDYRDYEGVSHICHLLGIKAEFILLTNNPDKIAGMRAHNLKIAGVETLEFDPSPFNLAYLASKQAEGHHLKKTRQMEVKRAIPPEPITPFQPRAIEGTQRFVYAASYFLPIRPVDDEVLLQHDQFDRLFADRPIEAYLQEPDPVLLGCDVLRNGRFLIRIHPGNLSARRKAYPNDPIADLLTTPYWFRVHVYYDIVTNQEFVVLTHGEPKPGETPVVRLQSESLFNRFPLKEVDNRNRLKKSLQTIIRYGVGAIILLYNDGRGAGFGAYAIDRMLTELGLTDSSDASYRELGVDYDSRDYDAAIRLLKHHIPENPVQMVLNCPSSLVKKKEFATSLHAHGVEVAKWCFLDG